MKGAPVRLAMAAALALAGAAASAQAADGVAERFTRVARDIRVDVLARLRTLPCGVEELGGRHFRR